LLWSLGQYVASIVWWIHADSSEFRGQERHTGHLATKKKPNTRAY
jgi:hypothetical protein